MAHLDDETFALAALGERLDEDSAAHLAGCPRCARELADLTAVVGTVRAAGPGQLEQPADRVWDAIAGELDQDLADQLDQGLPDATSLDDRRRSRGRGVWMAAASFLLGVGATAGVAALLDDDELPPVVAGAELEPLPGRDVAGSATLHEDDGRRTLVVEISEPEAAGVLEVWLLDETAEQLVSLGILDGTTGTFAVPPEIDLAQFPVVDVSDEPLDGDPGHGGDSVVRGQLG